jgi:hypothetical protein
MEEEIGMAQLLRKHGLRIAHDTGRILLGFWSVTDDDGRELAAYEFHRTAAGRTRCENICDTMPIPVNDPQPELFEELDWEVDPHLVQSRNVLKYADECAQSMYDKVLSEGGTKAQAIEAYYASFHQARNARLCGTW